MFGSLLISAGQQYLASRRGSVSICFVGMVTEGLVWGQSNGEAAASLGKRVVAVNQCLKRWGDDVYSLFYNMN